MDDEALPHLTPIRDEKAVNAFCIGVLALDDLPHHLRLETVAFRETRTPHDGRRLLNALRHSEPHQPLAETLQGILDQERPQ